MNIGDNSRNIINDMHMLKLRNYQQEASDISIKFFQSSVQKNSIIVLPTGSGKSLVIADIASRLDSPVIVFQPSKEILEQNYKKLCSYGFLECSVYSASFNSRKISKVTFATIGSVKNKPELFKMFKYIIVDECHLVNPKEGMYKTFIEQLNCKVLGLTATPYRLHTDGYGGSILKFLTRTRPRVFTDVIYKVQISTLLEQGFLSKLNYYNVDVIDDKKLKPNSTGAEYTDNSVKQEYKRVNFNSHLISIVQRLLNVNRKGILVFTRFIEEAEYVSLNIPNCAVVSSETSSSERERILRLFKAGEIKVVANVGVLTTGFDYPELDTIVLGRPTMSLSLYYQMVGRAIRPHPDKPEGWIVDLCGNSKRFGRVEDLKLIEPKAGQYCIMSNGKQLTNIYY